MKTLGKSGASKLRLNPAILKFDRPLSFRAKRSTTKSLGVPTSQVCDIGREALCRGADVLITKTIGARHADPAGPRDGSDPSFADALTKKLSVLSLSSSRDESSSSGFSRSSTSDDLYVLEGDGESKAEATRDDTLSEQLGGDDSDGLDSLSDEEWDENGSLGSKCVVVMHYK